MEEIIVIDLSKNEIVTLGHIGEKITYTLTEFNWLKPNQIKLKGSIINAVPFFCAKINDLDYLGLTQTDKAYLAKYSVVI